MQQWTHLRADPRSSKTVFRTGISSDEISKPSAAAPVLCAAGDASVCLRPSVRFGPGETEIGSHTGSARGDRNFSGKSD